MLIRTVTRRSLLRNGALTWGAVAMGTGLIGTPARSTNAADQKITFNKEMRKKKESLDRTAVHKFVRVAHSDLDMVKQMLAEEPGLVNATHDWGGGDFETGLGAASHVGNRQIASFLIDNGARPNIFTFAMLGNTAIVKAMLTALPELLNTPGPHGIPLIVHAKKGGTKSEDVVSYLESVSGQMN